MKMMTFAKRNLKEILRDPLTFFFSLGFPLVLIGLLSLIQANIPVALFEIDHLTPGITVFGLSFITLFTATIISKDRSSSLLQRLYTTPMTPLDFILGYTLPIIPIALGQGIVCYLAAIVLGLDVTSNILLALALNIPVSLLYIAMGRHLRRVVDEPLRMALRHLVRFGPRGRRAEENCRFSPLRPCSGNGPCGHRRPV